jgi:hypothetical protein
MSQKRRPERLKPSLKLLTPHEQKIVKNVGQQVADMWKHLFSLNKWTPQEIPKKVIASKKTNTRLPTNNQ